MPMSSKKAVILSRSSYNDHHITTLKLLDILFSTGFDWRAPAIAPFNLRYISVLSILPIPNQLSRNPPFTSQSILFSVYCARNSTQLTFYALLWATDDEPLLYFVLPMFRILRISLTLLPFLKSEEKIGILPPDAIAFIRLFKVQFLAHPLILISLCLSYQSS